VCSRGCIWMSGVLFCLGCLCVGANKNFKARIISVNVSVFLGGGDSGVFIVGAE